jgi:hypothetical protein
MYDFIANKVRKTKRGKPNGDNPTGNSIKELLAKIDGDAIGWFPGIHSGAKRGPQRVLRGPKKTAIISAAKRMVREKIEVTYPSMCGACPEAMKNPNTGEPVDKKALFTVFREDCHSGDPNDRWEHRPRLSREALDDVEIVKRYDWGKYMRGLSYTDNWYFENLVWCDLCNSLLPLTKRKASAQASARKSGKFWGSKSDQQHSANLRKAKHVLKFKNKDVMRVWWVPILTRGKFHIEMLPENFPGETEEGAATMVAKVRTALNVRFQGDALSPKVLFTDRGNGFFVSGSGKITDGYRLALREHDLRAFMGRDASVQPGSLQELMLHETAVSWVRRRLAKTTPRAPWEETCEEYGSRLKEIAVYINKKYDVDGVCRELPTRVGMLMDRKGDRIPK